MSANVIEFSIVGHDKFSKAFGKIGTVIAKVSTAAAAAGSAAFLMSKKFATAEDRAAKFAKRLGKSVEELTAIEFAGERAGLSVQQIDMSLQRVERRAAEAAAGFGEAKSAIAELGLNAQKFSSLGLEDKMQSLAKALEGIEDPATRTRIAFKLFDSEGVAMLQMLGDGEGAFKRVTDEARKFGAVISKQAAANAEKFMDSWQNLKTSFGSVFRGISDTLIPIFTNLMDRISNFLTTYRKDILTVVNDTVRGLFIVSAVGERVFNGLGKSLNQFASFKGIEEFGKNFIKVLMNIYTNAIDTFKAIGEYIISVFNLAFDQVRTIADWAWNNIKSIFTGEGGESLGDLIFKSLPDAANKSIAKFEEASNSMVSHSLNLLESVGTAATDIFNIDFSNFNQSVEDWTASFQTFGEVVDEVNAKVGDGSALALAKLTELWDTFFLTQQEASLMFAESLVSTLTTITDNIGQAFAGVIVEGANLMEAVKGLAKTALKELIAVLVKIGVQRLATSAIIKAVSVTESGVEAGKAAGLAFANTLASVSAAPWPISLTAPAVAATHAAIASTGFASNFASGKALGMGLTAAPHGGMDYIPKESTYLLDRGERVLSPRQNTDLTDFLSTGGSSALIIENLQIDVLPNATNANALLSMSRADMRDVVADAIIPALDALRRAGIKPLESV